MAKTSAGVKAPKSEPVEPPLEPPMEEAHEIGGDTDDPTVVLLRQVVELLGGVLEVSARTMEIIETIVDVIMSIEPGMKGSRS